MKNQVFTYIDLFSGIGGFKIALEKLGGKSIGYSEINKHAIECYVTNFNEEKTNNFGDIKKIKELPQHDFMTAGVPCQSWSIAGKKRGFDDERGQLWNDTLYLLNKTRPKAFIFENVKGLADPRNKESFDYILEKIKDHGYSAGYYLINSCDYGVRQNRERVYIIGFLEQTHHEKFKIAEPIQKKETKNTSLSKRNGMNDYFMLNDLRDGETTIHSWDIIETTHKQKEICRVLLKNRRKKIYGSLDGNPLTLEDFQTLDKTITIVDLNGLINLGILKITGNGYDFKNSKISTGLFGINRIFLPYSKILPTLVASDTNDYVSLVDIQEDNVDEFKRSFIKEVYEKKLYRKISKEEACEMQGFPIDFILPEKRDKWMKLIGNSVSVPVISMLAKSILDTGVFE